MTHVSHVRLALIATAIAIAPSFANAKFFVVTPSPGKPANAQPAPEITVSLAAASLPTGQVGAPYSYSLVPHLSVTGDPDYVPGSAVFSAPDSLPQGLLLHPDGTLSGTPSDTTRGTDLHVTADYKDKSGQQVYRIVVNGVALDVTALAAGGGFTCAITAAGGVKCWGDNAYGQLGNDSTMPSANAVQVIGLNSGVSKLAAGRYGVCAIQNNGAKCWGYGTVTGTGSYSNKYTPMQVYGMTGGVTDIAVGEQHACAIQYGMTKCWGSGVYGQLGNEESTTAIPVSARGMDESTAVAAGDNHSCAIKAGIVYCWGQGTSGQLGNGQTPAIQLDASAVIDDQTRTTSSGWSSIGAGGAHTCGLRAGALYCWGNNAAGQLGLGRGYGDTTAVPRASAVAGLSSGVTTFSAGRDFNCAVRLDTTSCWGSNSAGQLGDSTSVGSRRLAPVPVGDLPGGQTMITAGNDHACAVQGSVGKCWGAGSQGQLGDGKTGDSVSPVIVLR